MIIMTIYICIYDFIIQYIFLNKNDNDIYL